MDKKTIATLEARGWKVGTVAEFLGLSAAEESIVEIKVALSRRLKEERIARKWTQHALAERLETSQPRLAAMEAGGSVPTIDLLMRALLTIGVSLKDVAAIIENPHAGSERLRPAHVAYAARTEHTRKSALVSEPRRRRRETR